MAKAKFHKSQRVFVKPVGTWAYVEAVIPTWVKGCPEPLDINYDCGMGREFEQDELEEESVALQNNAANGVGTWRILRGHNRWKSPEQCGHIPILARIPWRTRLGRLESGAEYDLDPYRIERQAEIIVRAPIFMKLLEDVEYADPEAENLGEDLTKLAQIARRILSEVSG